MNLSATSLDDLSDRIAAVRDEHRERLPGGADGRAPVHTVHVPADRFAASAPADFGAEALRLLNTHTPGDGSFGAAFGLDPEVAGRVRERVAAKLAAEPLEDVRVDFGDGYGVRPDAEEDAHAARVVEAVAAAYEVKGLPHYWGLRVKSFADGGHDRAMRTLDGFLTALRDRLGRLPGGFTITLPNVIAAEHVALFTEYLDRLETALGLPAGILRFEIQLETPESLFDGEGRVTAPALVRAAAGRLTGAHFGASGYATALGLPPDEQRLDHPSCDFARHVMQAGFAGSGVRLSDGATDIVPRDDGAGEVNAVWAAHAAHVRHSLRHGFHQGWDLHPAHLPSRYAVVYGHHLTGVDDVIGRVRAWRERTGGGAEPAAIRSLTDRLRRAVDCGALDESDVPPLP
ncbi:DUF6986 family protein [Actinomadura algeriensis]|uniref:Citrate lyase beta subunit n=1 Tax=Actinomadura algeriensis TaxID=1679523 RepID=A0ABR9JXX6_9ACTN|nr:aldolase [Actinomadura algeriensis]MBE1535244.1 citrate lyase beta subunit [Actinomadura algeriensis]